MKSIFLLIGIIIFYISQGLTKAQDLTIPPKNYVDSVDIALAVERVNNKFPLSDQGNDGQWKLLKKYSDEFENSTINEKIWYPNNPKWKGRKPTYFHGSNVAMETEKRYSE